MLQQVSDQNFSAFRAACAIERVFGSKCLSAYRAYADGDTARFRVETDTQGRPAAALFLKNGVLVVAANEHSDPDVLAAFVRTNGVTEIDTNWTQCEALQKQLGGTTESSWYMEYRGGTIDGDFSGIFRPMGLGEVFSILQQSHAYYRAHLRYEPWAEDLHLRIARGLTEVFQLDLDGQPVGTGCILSEDDQAGAIAAVAVIPEFRGRGLGTRMSQFLVNRLLEKGKTPVLISGYDAVAALYRQVGFVETGRWGELYLH